MRRKQTINTSLTRTTERISKVVQRREQRESKNEDLRAKVNREINEHEEKRTQRMEEKRSKVQKHLEKVENIRK